MRVVIHSFEVSTTFSKSKLVMMVDGAADPTPTKRQFMAPACAAKHDVGLVNLPVDDDRVNAARLAELAG